MNKILITGASGYLAHRLLPIAQQYGEVTGIARNSDCVHAGAHQALSIDITDEDTLHAASGSGLAFAERPLQLVG